MSKVQIVWFRDLVRWDTEYFTGNHRLESRFKLVDLSEILIPRKERIKPNKYDGRTPIVAKIPFSNPNIELRKEPKTKMDMYAVYRNDLLVSNINFHQGAVAICRENKVFASTHYQPYIVNTSNIDIEFLVLVLRQSNYQQYINAKKIRGIKTESNFNFIKTLQIPLPPLEIQKEIVAKVESIKAQIKALQEEEKRLKNEIETYIYIALGLQKPKVLARQKVFIVRFKDLARWDTRHNQSFATNLKNAKSHTDSTTHEADENLSPSLRGEAEAIYLNPNLDYHADKSARNDGIVSSRMDATSESCPSSLRGEAEAIPTPPRWEIKTLGDICELNPKVDLQPLAKLGKVVSFLPMEAVKTDGKSFETLQRSAREAKGFMKFANNDLLWAKITPCMQNKKSVVVSGLKNGYGFGSTEFFVLRPRDSRQTNMYFVLQFLRLDIILQNAVKNLKGSAGQQRVPKEFLQNLQIPLPPLAVQEQIVMQVEQMETKISSIKSNIKSLELRQAEFLVNALSVNHESLA